MASKTYAQIATDQGNGQVTLQGTDLIAGQRAGLPIVGLASELLGGEDLTPHRPGDATFTWYLGTHGPRVLYDVALTAERTITLSNLVSAGGAAVPTDTVMEILRSDTGIAFLLQIRNHNGGDIGSSQQWRTRRYRFDGTNWVLVVKTGDMLSTNNLDDLQDKATARANLNVPVVVNSVAATGGLVNDTASPGNNKVYGTGGTGTRGWKDDPAGGNWTAEGTGAVSRTVQNKLREWPSIEDFGAVGVNSVTTGLTNNTAAIQAAIDAVAARGGGFVFVPAKVYGAGSTIFLKQGVHLCGLTPEGWFEGYRWNTAGFDVSAPSGSDPAGQHPTTAGRIQAMSGFSATTNLLQIDWGVTPNFTTWPWINRNRGWAVSGIILDAHRFAQDAFLADGAGTLGEKRVVLDRIYCTGAKRHGLSLLYTYGAQLSRIKSNGNEQRGINMQYGTADTQLTDIWLQGNGTNIFVGEGSIVNMWQGGKCEDAIGIGLHVRPFGSGSGCQLKVSGVSFQGNEGPGVVVEGGEAGADYARNTFVTLNNCLFYGNGRGGVGAGGGNNQGTTNQVAVIARQRSRVKVSASDFDRYTIDTVAQQEYGLRADGGAIFSSHNSWMWATAGRHYLEENDGKVVDRTGDCIDCLGATPVFQTAKYDFT